MEAWFNDIAYFKRSFIGSIIAAKRYNSCFLHRLDGTFWIRGISLTYFLWSPFNELSWCLFLKYFSWRKFASAVLWVFSDLENLFKQERHLFCISLYSGRSAPSFYFNCELFLFRFINIVKHKQTKKFADFIKRIRKFSKLNENRIFCEANFWNFDNS